MFYIRVATSTCQLSVCSLCYSAYILKILIDLIDCYT